MRYIYIIIAVLLAISGNVNAQTKKTTTAKATTTRPASAKSAATTTKPQTATTPQPAPLTKEEINFRDLLPSTAKITFVDSLVVGTSSLCDSLFLSKSTGKIVIEGSDSTATYTYTNDFGNYRIISKVDETGFHRLYSSSKVGNAWSETTLIDIPGNHKDLICPFLLNDGTTLYFSALDGENNVGKHDVFMTVYDSDDEKFMTPQSIGLPFNSPSNELYYIIDETNNIGYLVTERRQPAGRACIYAFLPTETREIYEDCDDASLRKYANIHSIANTQHDKESVAQALLVIQQLRNTTSISSNDFSFLISKNVSYHKLTDFRSSEARTKYEVYSKRKASLMKDEERLRELRRNYRNGQTYTASEIKNIETSIESERIAIRTLEEEVRKLELAR